MAYRRRQGITRASTFKEEIRHDNYDSSSSSSLLSSSNSFSGMSASAIAAQAIRASAAHRDSSLSSAYGDSAFSTASSTSSTSSTSSSDLSKSKVSAVPRYEYTSMNISNESKHGFWGILARKAKAILEEDNALQNFEMQSRTRTQTLDTSPGNQLQSRQSPQSSENNRKTENPRLRKGFDAITTSLNHIGDTLGNAFEEGRNIVENKTADIIQETRRLQIRRKGSSEETNQTPREQGPAMQVQLQQSAQPQLQLQPNQENQLKASRDVAMATAAKAKLLLRELKTVKADLAFAMERCAQLEEENKVLRECREKGDNPADDDLIRLQLETLLAEKARLAHENSVYARENRFLREIVEYHQLTMQDVVYLDEGIEEVTEVYPISKMLSIPSSPSSSPPSSLDMDPPAAKEILPIHTSSQETTTTSKGEAPSNSSIHNDSNNRQPASA